MDHHRHTRARQVLASAALAALALCAAACEPYFDRKAADAGSGTLTDSIANNYAGSGIDGACKAASDCRAGLTCQAGKCQALHTTAENGKCLLSDECGGGLHCSWAGFCTPQPAGATAAGGACEKTEECGKGLYCKASPASQCAAGGAGCGVCTAPDANNVAPENEECTAASQCPPGMVCALTGLSGLCKLALGKGDLGATCAATADCRAGLSCSPARKQCVPASVLLNPDIYGGVECPDEAENKLPFGAIVSVPRKGQVQDFYALPFPSDVYLKGGKLDISAHPTPGLGVIGFDAVQRVVESMAADMTGWGQTTGAYLRFTRAVDPKTIKVIGSNIPKEQATVRIVNLKTGADVTVGPGDAQFHSARNKYICRNALYVHARWSELLDPNTPYAVLVTDGIRQACGNGTCDKGMESVDTCPADCTADNKDTLKPGNLPVPAPGKDMAALLADAKPTDPKTAGPELEAAWAAYAPLRTWLKANPGVKPVSAAVFTTTNGRTQMAQLVDAAAAAGPIQLVGPPQLCKTGGAPSQCATPGWATTAQGKAGVRDPRECPANPDQLPYYEIHARIRLPIYQDGARPYATYAKPTEKVRPGALHLADGKPAVVNFEPVCMALTIPKGVTKPAAGWPLIFFAHGTGGSFRSGADGMATGLATNKVVVATLGIDGAMHATRQSDPDKQAPATDPGPLFYNFANPPAARGNFWQGAADNFALLRWAKEYKGEQSPAGVEPLTFDPANLVYMGHSQGSTTGPLALPYMAGLKGAVLSGCGGSLVFGLLGKKKPYDASVGLQIGLQDLGTDATHPVLNLFQNYFEVSDPLLYAEMLVAKPVKTPMHVLHTYGQGDSFTPPATSRIFAAAAHTTLGVPDQLPPWLDAMTDLGVASAKLPLTGNVDVGGQKYTAVTIEAKNDAANSLYKKAYDGHFVAFNDKTMVAQVLQFLGTIVKTVPTVTK